MLAQLRSEGPITAKEAMEGVTPASNWIIPGIVLIGDAPLPGSSLEMLLDYGVTFFVDLRASAPNYLQHATIEVAPDVDYRQFDLGSVVNTPTTTKLAEAADFFAGVIEVALLDQRVVYLHCSDGGQLTAVAACAILAHVYNVSALKASTIVSQQYGCRSIVGVQGSLFTPHLKTVSRELTAAVNAAMVVSAPPKPTQSPSPPTQAQRTSTPSQFDDNSAAPPPLPQYSSPNRALAKPATMSPDHLAERDAPPVQAGYASTPASLASTTPSSTVPTPASTSHHAPSQQGYYGQQQQQAPATQPQSTPASSHGRFAHTRGHGGGQSQLNIFGSGPDESTTPTRRGRGVVLPQEQQLPQQQQQRPPSAQSWSAHSSPATSMTAQTAAAVTAAIASGYTTPTAGTPVRPTCDTPTVGAGIAPSIPAPLEPKRTPNAVRGPTPTSNWVVQGAVCCGGKPIPGQHKYFAALAAERFNCFVTLTETDVSQDYLPAYEAVSQQPPGSVTVRSVPIPDGCMAKGAAATELLNVVEEVAQRVETDPSCKVYVHCDKGHGRTGLFVTALLWRLYGLAPMRAMNYCDALHSCRVITDDQSSPQTQDQRTGIVSLLLNPPATR